ncbi:SDR family oxidoreductase [Hymenobacter sp. UV11]|uniref:glucose 1-dehydrogenase n=1 Tax=Hymenobacter sp. UV11 TaxID=1849735 RepID=UPI00105BC281|nr:glucose 1-dehydrogenase [Hymenobacter sp. UV11]TDN38962.1 oxidoreductase [Hymenobacter sp. UV11]TFZ65953.1 SDR family oxidoreductase [Hymenobacter sp. UV11]
MATSQKLTGKIALITGGTAGIGLATAQRFVAEGAYVFITGRRQAELDAAVQQLGNQAFGVQGDVSSLADLDRVMATIKEQKGRLDVVFANAGIAEFLPVDAITEDHYDRQFDINVKGIVFTVQKALPLLPNGAAIIVMSSIVGSKGFGGDSIYSATKAAIRSLARTWTSDLKARKIRVNAISPGPIETPGLNSLAGTPEQAAQFKAQMVRGVPLGRLGEADEIAKAVVFLASNDSSYVTGAELFVDGGMAQV